MALSASGDGAVAVHAAGIATTPPSQSRISRHIGGLLPVLDLEFRLLAARLVGNLQFQVLRADAFLELDRSAPPVVAIVWSLAAKQSHQLVGTGLEIADVEPLHAALDERGAFTRRVEVIDDFAIVDPESDRIETEEAADIHRQEHRNLRVGGKQQLFLQHEQVLVKVDDLLLQFLDLFIQGTRAARAGRLTARRWSDRAALGHGAG